MQYRKRESVGGTAAGHRCPRMSEEMYKRDARKGVDDFLEAQQAFPQCYLSLVEPHQKIPMFLDQEDRASYQGMNNNYIKE